MKRPSSTLTGRLGAIGGFVYPKRLPDVTPQIFTAINGTGGTYPVAQLCNRESEIHARVFLYRKIDLDEIESEEVKLEVQSNYYNCLMLLACISHNNGEFQQLRNILLEILEIGDLGRETDAQELLEALIYNAMIGVADGNIGDDLVMGFCGAALGEPLSRLTTLANALNHCVQGEDPEAILMLRQLGAGTEHESLGANMLLAEIYHLNALPLEELTALKRVQTLLAELPDVPDTIESAAAGGRSLISQRIHEMLRRLIGLLNAAEQSELAVSLADESRKLLVRLGLEEEQTGTSQRRHGVQLVAKSRDELNRDMSVRETIRDLILASPYRHACLVNQSEQVVEGWSFIRGEAGALDEEFLEQVQQALDGVDVSVVPALVPDPTYGSRKWVVLAKPGQVERAIAVSVYSIDNNISFQFHDALYFETKLEGSKNESWISLQEKFLDGEFDRHTLEEISRKLKAYFGAMSGSEYLTERREF